MRSSWRLRLAAIVLAFPIVWLLVDQTLRAGKPEGSRPAGSVRLTGGFGSGGRPEDDGWPLQLTIHVAPRVTAKMAKTWELLQRPINLNFPNETPLEDFLKYLKAVTQGKDDKGLSLYVDPIGLLEAEKTITSPILIDLDGVKIATGLKLVLKQLGLIYYVREDGLIVITCDCFDCSPVDPNEKLREDLDALGQEVADLQQALYREHRAARPDDKKPEPAAPPAKKTQFRRAVQPGGTGGGAGAAPYLPYLNTKPVLTIPLLKPLTAQAAETWRRLHTEVDIPFADGTPLEDAIGFLKDKTRHGKDDKGIGFYVVPIGLQEAEKTITSPVILDLEGVTIATALDLMLKQLGMKFSVHDDGFVVIDSESADTPEDPVSLLDSINAIRLSVARMRAEVGQIHHARTDAGPAQARVTRVGQEKEEKKPAPVAPPAGKAQFRRAVQPGGMGAAPHSPALTTKPVLTIPLLKPLTVQAAETWRRLHTEVDVAFADLTPLDDVLRFLKEKTRRGKDDKGLGFYVNPVGLNENEERVYACILEVEGVTVETALNLMLKDLGLKFSVHDDGLVIIEKESAGTPKDPASLLDTINAIRLDVKAMRTEVGGRTGAAAC